MMILRNKIIKQYLKVYQKMLLTNLLTNIKIKEENKRLKEL